MLGDRKFTSSATQGHWCIIIEAIMSKSGSRKSPECAGNREIYQSVGKEIAEVKPHLGQWILFSWI